MQQLSTKTEVSRTASRGGTTVFYIVWIRNFFFFGMGEQFICTGKENICKMKKEKGVTNKGPLKAEDALKR